MGKITLLLSDAPPRDIALNKPRISIGRRIHNDIHLDDPAVSGEHAVILRDGQDAAVEDLDSTNGTRVNGQPVKKHFLRDGDVVEVATHRIVYHAASTAFARPPAGAPVLEVASGKNAGMRTALSKAITVIGADEHAALLIVRRGARYILIGDGGAGSVRVNGQSVGTGGCELEHKDVIQLPDTDLHFFHPSVT